MLKPHWWMCCGWRGALWCGLDIVFDCNATWICARHDRMITQEWERTC